MPSPQSQLIHQFLTQHPVGKAIAQHTRYGPGHPTHDQHAAAQQMGAQPGQVQPVSPTLARTPGGPINPALMNQLMAMSPGAGGPGSSPLPMPSGGAPAPQMPMQGGPPA